MPEKISPSTCAEGILQHYEPPQNLERFIFGFVYRDDKQGGDVVRVLPEIRSSIQVMVADPYWLKSRGVEEEWKRVPKVSLWGPKYDWCYGYAHHHIKAYAFGLTPLGLWEITNASSKEFVNQVLPLSNIQKTLENDIMPYRDEEFIVWQERIIPVLENYFTKNDPHLPDLDQAVEILASGERGSVRMAAQSVSLSERQFQRVFKLFYGVSPKKYQCALRVDRMIRILHENPWEGDDMEALPIHFSDQPHEIREFKKLIGLTPRQYIKAKLAHDRTIRSVKTEEVMPPSQYMDV